MCNACNCDSAIKLSNKPQSVVEELRAIINTGKVAVGQYSRTIATYEYRELVEALAYLSVEAKASYVERLTAIEADCLIEEIIATT